MVFDVKLLQGLVVFAEDPTEKATEGLFSYAHMSLRLNPVNANQLREGSQIHNDLLEVV